MSRVLVGTAASCSAHCVDEVVTSCVGGDGCCPGSCTNATDMDCAPVCGNYVLEAGETCDGDCPSSCDDGNACTLDTLSGGSATCDAVCAHAALTECTSGDGCCPAGCTTLTDSDCSAVCGNGVLEGSESCDGDCPVTCDDGDACTMDSARGSAEECSLVCDSVAVTGCTSGDGCCRSGCTSAVDSDCSDRAVWHYEVPSAGGEDVNGVWVFSGIDVWGVGNRGQILHWDGAAVTQFASGTDADLDDVWGLDATHVYAVGSDSTLLRFDGTSWTEWTVTGAGAGVSFEGVYASAADDVWVVDANAHVYHYHGTWTANMLPLSTARDIAGTGPMAVRVAGSRSVPGEWGTEMVASVASFNGLSWSADDVPWGRELRGIWMGPDSFTVVAGYQLNTWGNEDVASFYSTGTGWENLFDVGTGPVWAPSLTNTWFLLPYEQYSEGILRYSPYDMVATPTAGWMALGAQRAGAVHGAGSSEVWLGGTRGQLLEWNGAGFTPRSAAAPIGPCADVHAASSANVWAACGTEAIAWDGTSWTHHPVTVTLGTRETIRTLWSVSPTSVWAATDLGAILHFDGSTWTRAATYDGSVFVDSWASGDSDVWVADEAGGLAHWDGSSWSGSPSGATSISRLWGSSPTDVYAAGTAVAGEILHYDGSVWRTLDVGVAHQYSYVAGNGAEDVWIAGSYTAAHWDGTRWTEHSISADVTGLAEGGDGVPVVLDSVGALWRWNGTAWWEELVPSAAQFGAVGAVSESDVTVVGAIVMRLR